MPISAKKAPSTLPAGAKEIYVSAFNSAWNGTCKSAKDRKGRGDSRDACAAKVAWSAVKNKFKKGKGEDWVEKSFAECEIDIGNIPLPASLFESPVSAAETWIASYISKKNETQSVPESASFAWSVLRSAYEVGEDGLWQLKDGMIVRAHVDETDASEAVKTEPIIRRSALGGPNYRLEGGPLILEGMTFEQEQALLDANYGGEQAARPQDWPRMDWAIQPLAERSVEKIILQRRRTRAYLGAIEAMTKRGWTAVLNPYRANEYVLRGWLIEEGQPQKYQRGVFVRCGLNCPQDGTKIEDWRFCILSDQTSSTIAARVEPDYIRFQGPFLR